jgi:hypothetical protein
MLRRIPPARSSIQDHDTPPSTDSAHPVKIRDRHGRSVDEVLRGTQVVNLQLVRRVQALAYRQYLRQCYAAAYLGAKRTTEIDRIGVWPQPEVVWFFWTAPIVNL